MPFPWGQSTMPIVTFTCPHCRDIKSVFQGSVEVCDCPASQQQAVEDRERAAAHRRSQEAARETIRKEATERRRRRSK